MLSVPPSHSVMEGWLVEWGGNEAMEAFSTGKRKIPFLYCCLLLPLNSGLIIYLLPLWQHLRVSQLTYCIEGSIHPNYLNKAMEKVLFSCAQVWRYQSLKYLPLSRWMDFYLWWSGHWKLLPETTFSYKLLLKKVALNRGKWKWLG